MLQTPYETGLELIRHPVRPLVAILAFLLRTGACSTVEELLTQLPETIATEYASYDKPQALLAPYLAELEELSTSAPPPAALPRVINETGEALSESAALSALITQRILEKELERINSLFCGAEHCTLCCIGPEANMRQEYFDIPLRQEEAALFHIPRWQRPEAGLDTLADEFGAARGQALLVGHQLGLSLVLPRAASCPALNAQGRCGIYGRRPQVCRKPQIFPYFLEPLPQRSGAEAVFCLRGTLLAVMDCPYVRRLQDDIARYAAASELKMIFRQNKA